MSPRAIVCGAGGISGSWFPPLKAEAVDIAAVVDLRRETAEAQVAKYELKDTKVFTDLDQALREVKADFLVDLTVPPAHCQVVCKALHAGLHVIGEKPMASSMKEAHQMVAASEKSGKLYMVSQSRRWNKLHDSIRRTLPALGTLTALHCDFYIGAHFGGFRDEMASPLILDMAIHHFDLARMLSGLSGVNVYAEEFNPHGSWYKGDVAAHCLFEMDRGVRFTYRGSWCAEGMHTGWNGDWRFIGEQGTLLYSADKDTRGELLAGNDGFFRPKKPLELAVGTLTHEGMHGALRELLAFLRTGTKPQTECHDNIQSLAMVFAVIESSRTGQRVKLSTL